MKRKKFSFEQITDSSGADASGLGMPIADIIRQVVSSFVEQLAENR